MRDVEKLRQAQRRLKAIAVVADDHGATRLRNAVGDAAYLLGRAADGYQDANSAAISERIARAVLGELDNLA